MPLSKRHIDNHAEPYPIDRAQLASAFEQELPEAVFAYLMGSAAGSMVVPPYGDVDISVYLFPEADRLPIYDQAQSVVEDVIGPVRCDLGFLNNAEPVYRFEALKGAILFCRDEEMWLRFYSLTCREYEHQMADYEKQLRYRLEAAANQHT